MKFMAMIGLMMSSTGYGTKSSSHIILIAAVMILILLVALIVKKVKKRNVKTKNSIHNETELIMCEKCGTFYVKDKGCPNCNKSK